MSKRFFGHEMPTNTVGYLVLQGTLNRGRKVTDADADRFAALVGAVLRSAVPECQVRVDVIRNGYAEGRVPALSFSDDVSPAIRERAAAALAGLTYSSATA
jgi:hypothetical protein